MNARTTRRPTRCHPLLSALEDRVTPTVDTLLFTGLTPGIGGAGMVSIGGMINDSLANPLAPGALSVVYQISKTDGTVLASGPMTPQALPGTTAVGFSATVPVLVPAGSTEVITIGAMDTDRVPVSVASTLFISPTRGVSTLAIGAWDADSGSMTGFGYGHITMTRSTTGCTTIRGNGSVWLASASGNTPVYATGSGNFTMSYNTQGDIALSITNGKGTVAISPSTGTTELAAAATATSTVTLAAAGSVSLTRYATGAVNASLKGSLCVSMSNSTMGKLTGSLTNASICLKGDGSNHWVMGLSGKLKLRAALNTSGLTVLG